MQSHQLKTNAPNNYLQQTPHPKIKPLLKSKTTWRCMFSSDISYINKYKPKMLSTISIHNLGPKSLEPTGSLKNLRKALIDSKRVSSLTFHNSEIKPKQLDYLFQATNRWRKFNLEGENGLQKFPKTVSRLGRCKDLLFLPLSEQSSDMPNYTIAKENLFNRICRQLKQLGKLKTLDIVVPLYRRAGILNFRPPRSLKNIGLYFKSKTAFNQQKLSQFLSQSNQLEHLRLYFGGAYLIEASDVEIWTSFFQNAQISFKRLTIDLILHSRQQPGMIQSFLESFKHVKNLTSLNLRFFSPSRLGRPSASSDSLFSPLLSTIQSMIQLKELGMKLFGFSNLKDETLKEFALTLECLKNLKKLSLKLPPLQSPNEGFVRISESLKGLVHLKAVEIKLPDDNLGQKSMEIFSNNIPHQQLNSLSLNRETKESESSSGILVSKSDIKKVDSIWKNTNLLPFFKNIQKFTQLSQLELRLSLYDISAQEWKELSLALDQLKELSSLYLTLPKFDSAEDLQSLLSCLPNFPKLTSLTLIFKGKISDQEIDIFASNIAECQSLKALRVRFENLSQVEDKSLNSLLSGIQGLEALENLLINLQKQQPFGEKAVNNFLRDLSVLKNLSTFEFHNRVLLTGIKNASLPRSLEDYKKLRRLVQFTVNKYRYI